MDIRFPCISFLRCSLLCGGCSLNQQITTNFRAADNNNNIQKHDMNIINKYSIAAFVTVASIAGASAQDDALPEPSELLSNATSLAETALQAGIGLGVVVIGWRLVKRFLTRG